MSSPYGGGRPCPTRSQHGSNLEEVRALAGPDGPETLQAALVSAGIQREFLLRAGGGLSLRQLPVYPVLMSWADGRSVLLEPATDEACAKGKLPLSAFNEGAWARMQQALGEVDAILVTHEHFDHLCGVSQSPRFAELAPKLHLTTEQLDSDVYLSSVTPELREAATRLSFDRITSFAPGVVLIKAPGHTPGSLWVYVRQRSGAEWLFVGDTLWTEAALEHGVSKPYIISWVGGEDGAQQAEYVRFLMDLRRDHPEVRIMVAHDEPTWVATLASGAMLPL